MDHPVSQRCRIYQFECIQIRQARHQMSLLNDTEGWLTDLTSPVMESRNNIYNFGWYVPVTMHNATAEMSLIGLSRKAVNAIQKVTKSYFHVVIVPSTILLAVSIAQQRMPHTIIVRRQDIGKSKVRSPRRQTQVPRSLITISNSLTINKEEGRKFMK